MKPRKTILPSHRSHALVLGVTTSICLTAVVTHKLLSGDKPLSHQQEGAEHYLPALQSTPLREEAPAPLPPPVVENVQENTPQEDEIPTFAMRLPDPQPEPQAPAPQKAPREPAKQPPERPPLPEQLAKVEGETPNLEIRCLNPGTDFFRLIRGGHATAGLLRVTSRGKELLVYHQGRVRTWDFETLKRHYSPRMISLDENQGAVIGRRYFELGASSPKEATELVIFVTRELDTLIHRAQTEARKDQESRAGQIVGTIGEFTFRGADPSFQVSQLIEKTTPHRKP